MAEETTTEAPATDKQSVAPSEKKTPKPRALKAVAEPKTSAVSAAPIEKAAKATPAKPTKIGATKVEKSAEVKKIGPRATNAKAPGPAPAASVEVTDDIADLIKLEEENKQLRRQLSEKLRAENADLRKRLGQG